jgi:hypothetical protein
LPVTLIDVLKEALAGETAPELKEIDVWLSNGRTVRGVEAVEVRGHLVCLHTLTERVHVREQDVIAVTQP